MKVEGGEKLLRGVSAVLGWDPQGGREPSTWILSAHVALLPLEHMGKGCLRRGAGQEGGGQAPQGVRCSCLRAPPFCTRRRKGPPLPLGMVVSARPPPCSTRAWGAYWVQWPQDRESAGTPEREEKFCSHTAIY